MTSTTVRRFGPLLGALVVLGLLVWVTVASASSVDSKALSNAVPVGTLPSGALPAVPTGLHCRVTRTAAGASERVRFAGACRGSGGHRAACNPGDDALAASEQFALRDGRTLTVTVIVPDYPDAGKHDDADIFVQVNRAGGSQRWSARGTDVRVDGAGRLLLASLLTPDPGTQTTGRVRISGAMDCGTLPT